MRDFSVDAELTNKTDIHSFIGVKLLHFFYCHYLIGVTIDCLVNFTIISIA